MKKILIILLVLHTFLLVFSGCGSTDVTGGGDEPFARIVDQMGRELLVPKVPERIISISPANTEIAFALGLGDRLVGVTDYCSYPTQAQDKTSVGGYSDPNLEKIVALEPDLILAGSFHKEEVLKLDEMGIPVLVLDPQSLEEIYESFELVAIATGAEAEFKRLAADMKGRIDAVEERLASLEEDKKVRVYFEVYSDPLMSAGNKAEINEIISLAGGINIFADIDGTYPVVSAEAVVKRDPQVILFPDYHGTEEFNAELLQERPGWGEIDAVKNGRVHAVENDVFSRPGPRFVEAVEAAAKLFYPDLF
ncbi:MAG: cobalamin-binding protein [Bacillota bacterium]|nr:cobalamin-binding protein [Bacillota bacterium]